VYEDEGEGTPLVFLHGAMSCALYWKNLVPQLLGEHRCIRVAFAGHGRSDRDPRAAYTIRDNVRRTAELLDREIGPAVLVGASWGGGTAFGVAAQRPELVQAIYSERTSSLTTDLTRTSLRAACTRRASSSWPG
jgi:haloalkane dehalogenase